MDTAERAELDTLRARCAELEAMLAEIGGAADPETTANAQPGPGRNALFSAIQSTRMPMILTDPHQRDNPIIFANRSFVTLSGYTPEELIGRNCRFLQGEDTSPETVARVREAIAARTTIAIDIVNYRKDGSRFVNELYISPVFGPAGNLLYFFGSQVDVTAYTEARLSMQLTLIERERYVLSQIVEGVPLAQVLEDLLRVVEAQHDGGMRTSILFLSEDGRHLRHGAAPNLPAAYNDAVDGIAISEGNGSCGTAASRGAPVYVADIAEDPLWRDYRALALAHGLRACWSTPIQAVDGTVLGTFAIYYDKPRSPTKDEIAAIGFVAQTAALAIERHRNDLEIRQGEERLQAANTALETTNRRLRAAIVAAELGTFTWDILTGEVELDARSRRIFGFGDGAAIDADTLFGRIDPMVLPGIQEEAFASVAERRSHTLEYPIVLPDGRRRVVRSGGDMVADGMGEVAYMVGTFADVTDQRLAEATLRTANEVLEHRVAEALAEQAEVEEQLRQAQKMEAVGQLTGGLAHDFNNLLTGMMGNLELLQLRVARGRLDDLDRFINAAQGAGRRAAALTQRLLAFSRRQTLDPKPTDVNRLVIGLDDMLRRTVGATIGIEIVGAAGLWTVDIDGSQLENAILNLCINGRDAMPEGGKLTIETANKWIDDRTGRERDLVPGQYISVCVTDTGTGMSPETIRRAFEPFYTTKPIGQGTGLGLSMIYGFAKQSGGQVRIYSEPGQGTTMCIYLPRSQREAAAVDDTVSGAMAESTNAQTVLVVDDEATIRHLIDEVLDDLGYTVIGAADGAAGLKVLQSGARIELLITDVGLPNGMNGRQVADAARALRPGLKVLFITGFAENAAVGNGHLEPGMELLTKPFTLEALSTKVAEMLRLR